MPLRVAREKALEAIQLIQRGVDPNKPTESEIYTLADQWQEYEATLRTRERSDRTIADFVCDLRYFRDWQHLSLEEIGANRKGVRERHKQISKKHGPYIANRAMRALRAAYNLALRVDYTLPANPSDVTCKSSSSSLA